VIQEKVVERVGGVNPIPVNIRIITATNKHLKEEMEQGHFREDLFYRLNVVCIVLPPLKQRLDDLRLLSNHFIKKYADERGSDIPVKGLDQDVERLFNDYSWPGNVRELENVIERAMIMCPDEIISVSDLPKDFRNNVDNSMYLDGIPKNAQLYETVALIEKNMIKRALKLANDVQSNAAEILGISKSSLSKKISKYEMSTDIAE